LVNDAPTTVAATTNDFTNDVCRKFQRRMPQETPQRPTMDAARFNDVCRSHAAAANDRRRRKCRRLPRCLPQECRSRVPQKNRPKNSPGKDRHLGVGSLGSQRVVENFHACCAVGRHWPCQVAYALWRRAAHRDCPPHVLRTFLLSYFRLDWRRKAFGRLTTLASYLVSE
jgi:hypothetical protein